MKPEDIVNNKLSALFKSAGAVQSFSKNELLQSTSDKDQNLFMIKSGYVKRYQIKDSGSESIQSIYGEGVVFPMTLVVKAVFNEKLYDGPEDFFYETIDEAEIYALEIQRLLEELEKDSLLYKDLLHVAGRRLRSNIHHIENRSLGTSYQRVASQLLFFAKKLGTPTSKGVVLDVPITHQVLADILEMARETVTREITQLRDDKLIEIKRNHKIRVPDLQKLEDAAYNLKLQ